MTSNNVDTDALIVKFTATNQAQKYSSTKAHSNLLNDGQSYKPIKLKPPLSDISLKQQLADFFHVLGYKPGDQVHIRALLPKKLSKALATKHNLRFEIKNNGKLRTIANTRRGYLTIGSWSFNHFRHGNKKSKIYHDGLAELSRLNSEGRGIYFVVNPGGGRDSEILEARSIFWECDNRVKAEQIEQARTAGIAIGLMVETHKSVHCYSPLSNPITDLGLWQRLQERVIQQMDSDQAIRNRSRLMRLPGFDHVRVCDAETPEEHLVFSPVTIRHMDNAAQNSVESLESKLPAWDKHRWIKVTRDSNSGKQFRRQALPPTLASENPWDIRNFSQYLGGDQLSVNGWLQVKCPYHGKADSSGTSLGIKESTGQFTCHSGCDTKSVYKAAKDLAKSKGWQPPPKKT